MTIKVSTTFRQSGPFTLVLLLLATLFTILGMWQSKRAEDKAATEQLHQAATAISLETALARDSRFARIDVSGHYDPVRHILLDNQIWKGRAGVHVFTPFYTLDGIAILVNRGWLPLPPDRKTLPAIATPSHETVLRGMLNIFPVPGRTLGQADKIDRNRWPQLVTYLNINDIVRSLDIPLENRIIQLSGSELNGFEGRVWKPVFMSSSRHRAYAFQWFALTTACFVLWIFHGFRKPLRKKR